MKQKITLAAISIITSPFFKPFGKLFGKWATDCLILTLDFIKPVLTK